MILTFGTISVIFYIITRIIFDSLWRKISIYWGYGFEVVYVAAVYYHYRNRIQFFSKKYLFQLLAFLTALFCGFWIYELAIYSHLPIRFDMRSGEIIFLLLIVAPILEEFIFRLALWEPLKELFGDESTVNILCAILFSVGHFTALWNVQIDYRAFVLYQTLYVILLALSCGWARIRTRSVFSSIIIHFGFNLGFFIGSLVALFELP
jgi:membrane protease YdiL (CAAX protease family)